MRLQVPQPRDPEKKTSALGRGGETSSSDGFATELCRPGYSFETSPTASESHPCVRPTPASCAVCQVFARSLSTRSGSSRGGPVRQPTVVSPRINRVSVDSDIGRLTALAASIISRREYFLPLLAATGGCVLLSERMFLGAALWSTIFWSTLKPRSISARLDELRPPVMSFAPGRRGRASLPTA